MTPAIALLLLAAAPQQVTLVLAQEQGNDEDAVHAVADRLTAAFERRGIRAEVRRGSEVTLPDRPAPCGSDPKCLAEASQRSGWPWVLVRASSLQQDLAASLALVDPATGRWKLERNTAKEILDTGWTPWLDDFVGQVLANAPAASQTASSTQTVTAPPTVKEAEPEVELGERFTVAVRAQIDPRDLSRGAWVPSVGYRFTPEVAAELGALIAKPVGATARVAWTPWARHAVHPVLAAEGATIFSSPVGLGLGGSVGVEWVPMPRLSVGAEVPVLYFVTAPDGVERAWVFLATRAAVRF